jgi:hypothetical protein
MNEFTSSKSMLTRSSFLLFFLLIAVLPLNAQQLKSVIYDFDGLGIGETNLPEGDYRNNDLFYSVSANPLGDSPMLGDRVLKINMNWSTGSGSFGRGISRFIEFNNSTDMFNFYFYNPTTNGNAAQVDVMIAEDDDNSYTYSSAADDSWIRTVSIPTSPGWQLISVPLNSFTDNNPGGNGVLDASFSGNKGMLLTLEMRIRGGYSGTSTYYMDLVCFTDGPMPHGATILDLPPGYPEKKCPLGAFEGKPTHMEYTIPGEVESFFPAQPGKKLKYVNWFIQFAMDGTTVPKSLPGNEVSALLSNGYTPIITWEPMFQGYDRLDPVQPRLNNIINGDYNAYIDAFADKCKSYNDTIIIRFMHEFEGDWYSWSLTYNGQDPNRYKQAYQTVVNRFKARGATKVKWMWCVNGDYAPYRAYNWVVPAYPGDAYVDIIATDIYNGMWPISLPWWCSFRYRATESYYYLTKYIPQKPLIICEVGCRERHPEESTSVQNKAAWWGVMDKELQADFKNVRGLVFFSEFVQENWRMNSSQSSIDGLANNLWNDPYYFGAATAATVSASITSPANNSSFTPGSSITINANASTTSGTITKVEFFSGSTKLGEDLTSPYSFTWQSVPAGNYSLTAKATNSASAIGTSAPVNITVASSTTANGTLVPMSSSWKYLDNGTNQGTAWSTLSYSDAGWKTGNAQLGYGDGDEATTVSYGTNSSNKYITTYFRKTFTVQDKSALSGLTLKLLRDDGAVVYINGTEVYRNNMPSGTIGYTTLAPVALSEPDEYTPVTAQLSTAALVNGTNVIAVEVHQSSNTSSDLSFNLELTAGTSTPVACGSPTGLYANNISSAGATMNWSAVQGATSYNVFYRKTGTATWTQTTSSVNNKSVTGLSASTQYEFTVQALCSSGSGAWTSLGTFTTSGAASSSTLITTGGTWKYLDNGTNQGTAWRTLSYSDAAWKTGNAQLGYGDGDETTVIGYGPDAANKYITTYFRKTFTVQNPALITALQAGVLRDDGAVVYLNGTEVFRSNMPGGTISYNTPAATAISSTQETTFYTQSIPTSLLVAGTNLIAVEVHQSSGGSSDMGFALQLTATSSARLASEEDSTSTIALSTEPAESENDFQLNISPNPAARIFMIDGIAIDGEQSSAIVEIYNISGQLVFKTEKALMNGSLKEAVELPLTVNTGVYILRVSIGDKKASTQLVITE